MFWTRKIHSLINEEVHSMNEKLNTVLLLDDNGATNIIHEKFITKANCAEKVVKFKSGAKALQYLKSEDNESPNLIFVDILMPIMNGWEFLEEFVKMEPSDKKKSIIVLLSTSLSSTDREKANNIKIIDEVRLKPLTVKAVQEIVADYFPKKAS